MRFRLFRLQQFLPTINLNKADLIGATLQGANLHKAKLMSTLLQGANLQGAILKNAILWRASLTDMDLKGANLHGADLQDNPSSSAISLQGSLYNTQEIQLGEQKLFPTQWPVGISPATVGAVISNDAP